VLAFDPVQIPKRRDTMIRDSVSRRRFIKGSGALAGSSLLRIGMPSALVLAETACTARDDAAPFQTLSTSEGREVDALVARIIPTTDTPGAREAGVVYFFDTVLGDQFASKTDTFRLLHDEFQSGVASRFPSAEKFSDLSEADQDTYIGENETTAFFDMLQSLTVMGFFAMSSYGGNKDNIGWKLIGFDGHGASQPPYGYYDAEYMKGAQDDN
jgi:gluconate 2-dehydrogenase gamma chain